MHSSRLEGAAVQGLTAGARRRCRSLANPCSPPAAHLQCRHPTHRWVRLPLHRPPARPLWPQRRHCAALQPAAGEQAGGHKLCLGMCRALLQLGPAAQLGPVAAGGHCGLVLHVPGRASQGLGALWASVSDDALDACCCHVASSPASLPPCSHPPYRRARAQARSWQRSTRASRRQQQPTSATSGGRAQPLACPAALPPPLPAPLSRRSAQCGRSASASRPFLGCYRRHRPVTRQPDLPPSGPGGCPSVDA